MIRHYINNRFERETSAKFVPRVLTVEQKQQRLSISLELSDRAASDSSFLRNVITGEETRSVIMILRPGFRIPSGNHTVLLVRKKSASINIQYRGDDCVFDLDGTVRAVCTEEHYGEL